MRGTRTRETAHKTRHVTRDKTEDTKQELSAETGDTRQPTGASPSPSPGVNRLRLTAGEKRAAFTACLSCISGNKRLREAVQIPDKNGRNSWRISKNWTARANSAFRASRASRGRLLRRLTSGVKNQWVLNLDSAEERRRESRCSLGEHEGVLYVTVDAIRRKTLQEIARLKSVVVVRHFKPIACSESAKSWAME